MLLISPSEGRGALFPLLQDAVLPLAATVQTVIRALYNAAICAETRTPVLPKRLRVLHFDWMTELAHLGHEEMVTHKKEVLLEVSEIEHYSVRDLVRSTRKRGTNLDL